MDISTFIETASSQELQEELCRLAIDDSPESLSTLEEFLRYRGRSEKKEDGQLSVTVNFSVPRLTTLALLQRGPAGVRILVQSLSQYGSADMFGALWWASKGKFVPDPLLDTLLKHEPPRPELVRPLSPETIYACRDAVNQLIIEARTSPALFFNILTFLSFSFMLRGEGLESIEIDDIYDIMTSGAIKLSRPLLQQFDEMIKQNLHEEDYQVFLKQHPVFLDPLAADVIPKQKLGSDMVTDFAIRRYDNKYILVEVEKPQDRLFTLANEFTRNFTHAFGQVLDFQQWVDSNAAYAKDHMPGISSPHGLLVIGRRTDMTKENKVKLHRFSVSYSAIDIVTFDDLLQNATNLYEAILRKGTLK